MSYRFAVVPAMPPRNESLTRHTRRPAQVTDSAFDIYDCHGKQRLAPTFANRRNAEAACQLLNGLYRSTRP